MLALFYHGELFYSIGLALLSHTVEKEGRRERGKEREKKEGGNNSCE